jgi:hypothetical protein
VSPFSAVHDNVSSFRFPSLARLARSAEFPVFLVGNSIDPDMIFAPTIRACRLPCPRRSRRQTDRDASLFLFVGSELVETAIGVGGSLLAIPGLANSSELSGDFEWYPTHTMGTKTGSAANEKRD